MESGLSEPASGKPRIAQHELRRLITAHVADVLGLRHSEVEADRPLAEYGLSSREAVTLAGYLETLLGRPLSPTVVWEQPTVADLASLAASDTGRPCGCPGGYPFAGRRRTRGGTGRSGGADRDRLPGSPAAWPGRSLIQPSSGDSCSRAATR